MTTNKPSAAQIAKAREIVETNCGTDYHALTGGDFKRARMSEEIAIAQALADAVAEERARCHECIQSVLEVADMIHDNSYVDAVFDMHHAFDYVEKP